jgi:outer membrane lipoprotein-sorting protein
MTRLIAAAAGIAFMFSAAAQDPAPDVQEVFRLFSEERDEVRSMQARFTQVTMSEEDEIESTGTVVYVNPKRIIFRYDDPPVTYMIDQSDAYEYDEELEQLLVYDIQGQPEAEAFFLGLESDTKSVQDAYDMRLLKPKDPERDAFALELIPKLKEDQESIFQKVTLQLGKEDYLPRRIEIINSEEAHVVFELTDFVLNEALARNRSHLFVPENTDVVINDEMLDPVSAEGHFYPEPKVEADVDDAEDAEDDE